jgi:hypothetical protein
MIAQHKNMTEALATVATAAEVAARSIPPAWPLASSVAVNPFLGQIEQGLAQTGAQLARVAGCRITMPRSWYATRIASGEISDADLSAALSNAAPDMRPANLTALKAAALQPEPELRAVPSVAELASKVTGTDWTHVVADRIGHWAASYFDEGQALWAAPRGSSAYRAWRDFAVHDLTPEIAGLKGFAAHVAHTSESPHDALVRATERLSIGPDALKSYFHQRLLALGGWSQFARYKLWQAELAGTTDSTIIDLLAISLIWEEALFACFGDQIAEQWAAAKAAHADVTGPSADLIVNTILQDAAERAAQRALAVRLALPTLPESEAPPALQAVFCIDVRSEVFRRALESLSPAIQTMGFAGFFGLTTSHRRFGSDVEELRLPVLLNPGLSTLTCTAENAPAEQAARIKARAKRAWGRFKLAAVSSFAFVEAAGPIYVGKLLIDAFGLKGAPIPNDPSPRTEPNLLREARAKAAKSILQAMSFTHGFARLVLLAGHGANVVNNPHASSLHCGACGGYSGEVNARLLAQLLNDANVRIDLASSGIYIPADTLFLAALHDTTTDDVTLYTDGQSLSAHQKDLAQAKSWLAAAGQLARSERALRLPRASKAAHIPRRSRDWAETRPEWALAGCQAFIAAPRARTVGKSLAGRAFLHDYDWRRDEGFGVLELILTAPVVVASWISLQYYGSTVAPNVFGGGNKLLHNVVGGIGVVEGSGGVMRAGLPLQSVHDGERFVHEPLRLSVCVEAPRDAIIDILGRHPQVRALFDNNWLHLFALDDKGRMAWRYGAGMTWSAVN